MIKTLVSVVFLAVAVSSFPSFDKSSNEIHQQFIVGGRKAEPNEFPYQVALRNRTDLIGFLGFAFCGGSIISDEWVLSAAHCFYGKNDSKSLNHTEVVIGSTYLRLAEGQAIHKGLEVTVHPGYHPNTSEHLDLALIHVKGGGLIQKNQNFTSSAITLNTQKQVPVSGSNATVSGYGTGYQKFPIPNWNLKTTDIKIEEDAVCEKLYEGAFDSNDLCAGDPSGKTGACFGDSGGPLVIGQGKDRIQVGVVSRGLKCAAKDTPKIYVRVSSFIPWIKKVTGLNF